MNDDSRHSDPEHPALTSDQHQFLAELRLLSPREDRLDRERLAFLAGQESLGETPGSYASPHSQARIWRAAFAAMSAVAASLLIALLMRPGFSPGTPELAGTHAGVPARVQLKLVANPDVLSIRDLHAGDIETRLAHQNRESSASQQNRSEVPGRSEPALTPIYWRRLIDSASVGSPDSGALNHHHFQGVVS